MTLQQYIRRLVGKRARTAPRLFEYLKDAENRVERYRHSAFQLIPSAIRPRPYKIMVSITADCNALCHGCRYGRDFMTGHRLSVDMVCSLLDDAAAAGFYSIRFYGGEPLLHPGLPQVIAHCVSLGMRPYVTTNGVLLHKKIDALVDAGLRDITLGFYGVGEAYDAYTQTPGLFAQVERGIAAVAARHGHQVQMQMNWLLMQPTASVEALRDAREFAERYAMTMRVDLIHYSLPYFQEGPDRYLQFGPEDRPSIESIVDELIAMKLELPESLNHTLEGLRSIPDWLIKGPDMRVPCTAYELLWVGADGSVQLCDVAFPLGNLHEQRLGQILFGDAHERAARDAFQLKCPNCTCKCESRITKHAPSYQRFRSPG